VIAAPMSLGARLSPFSTNFVTLRASRNSATISGCGRLAYPVFLDRMASLDHHPLDEVVELGQRLPR
jgi:hypothetical protein